MDCKIPLAIKTWAGDEPHDMAYIQRSLPSLLASNLPPEVEIVIYDDCSPNKELRCYLEKIAQQDKRVRLIFNEINRGPNWGQADLYQIIAADYPDAPFFLNADDDVVYHRDWLTALMRAKRDLGEIGRTGIFTALNMPYREPHSVVRVKGHTYYLKWKQPALNWLIPREIYADIGPFRDEGIAYDTVYSHWLRLKGYSVICLKPSYVQNIGLLGAYAVDDTTTSRDFVGEGDGYPFARRLSHALRYTLRRLPGYVRGLTDDLARQIAPVRWGTEFVHEGIDRAGESVAMYSFEDAVRLGWSKEEAGSRVSEVQQADPNGAAGIAALRRNRQGTPVWVECRWWFSPNLRELVSLNLPQRPPVPELLFCSMIRQLLPLHAKGVAHNKIRQDNVYAMGEEPRLMWLGTEPHPGTDFLGQGRERTIELLSGALNRWALAATREEFAARYLESMAPEVMQGHPATPASDLFAAAAVTVLALAEPVRTIDQMEKIRGCWGQEGFAESVRMEDAAVQSVIRRCLATDPAARPKDAMEAAGMLGL